MQACMTLFVASKKSIASHVTEGNLTYVFLSASLASLLSRGINLPVHLCIYQYFLFWTSFKVRFLSHFCAYLFWMCFAMPLRTIYLITVDNWCAAFAINYGSVKSLKEFFSCPLCCFVLRPIFFSANIMLSFSLQYQLQIEFKRHDRLFYRNCTENDINFTLLHK